MTTLERFRQALEQLPEDMQERVADYILRYVDAYTSLRDEISAGTCQLDGGRAIAAGDVIARLRERYRA